MSTLRRADADVIALQECWETGETTQAHQLAEQLDRHAAFVAPGLPPAPDPPETSDQEGVDVGIGLLSRWPIVSTRPVTDRLSPPPPSTRSPTPPGTAPSR